MRRNDGPRVKGERSVTDARLFKGVGTRWGAGGGSAWKNPSFYRHWGQTDRELVIQTCVCL